jgi:hypothetical protein
MAEDVPQAPPASVAALDQLAAVRDGLGKAAKALAVLHDLRDNVAAADEALAVLDAEIKPVRGLIPDGVYDPLHMAWDAVKVLRAALADPAVVPLLDYGRDG